MYNEIMLNDLKNDIKKLDFKDLVDLYKFTFSEINIRVEEESEKALKGCRSVKIPPIKLLEGKF